MTRVGALFERIPGGLWVGTCPSVPGAMAQGRSLSACRRRLLDAIESVLLHAPSDDLEDLADGEAIEARAELIEIEIPERPESDLLTQAEIARIAGVTRQAVGLWVRREDFPRSHARTTRGAAWRRDDVLHWLTLDRRTVGRPSARAKLRRARVRRAG